MRNILPALAITTLASLSSFSSFADEEPLAAEEHVVIRSNEVDVPAWKRHLVTISDGELKGAAGVVADLASATAVSNVSAHAAEVSEAALEAVGESLERLYAVTNLVPEAALNLALAFVPSARSNLTGYVVAESTDGTNDVHWVHYNYALSLKPNRTVEYTWPGGSGAVSAQWEDWTAEGITTNGWAGVHKCTVTRPEGARGARCLVKRNEMFGGAGGFDFGSATVTVDGIPTYTGAVTNGVTGEILTFDNGALK